MAWDRPRNPAAAARVLGSFMVFVGRFESRFQAVKSRLFAVLRKVSKLAVSS